MFSRIFVAGVLCLWMIFQQPPSAFASSTHELDYQREADAYFSNGPVCEIHIELSPEAIESLNKDSRKFVHAKVREGSNTFLDIGLHLKGHSTFLPLAEKPSLSLKFNRYTTGQRFHGLHRIALNNSMDDPTFTTEELCSGLFRAIGVPAARVTHARVWLNERYLGFYVLLEGFAKDFLKLHFNNNDGNLYQAYGVDIDQELPLENGEDTSHADLKALATAAQEADAALRWQRLGKLLDRERFISMMAGEVLMAHWDGYYNSMNNYRIYHDTATERLVFLPCGFDQMFEMPDIMWRPELHNIMGKAVLQTSEGQDLYRERFWSAYEGPFRGERLFGRLDQIASRIRPVIAEDGTNALNKFDKEMVKLRQRINKRLNFLAGELAALTPRLGFAASDTAKLAGWQRKVESGASKLDQVEEAGKTMFHLKASGGGKAFWFTRALLDSGKYVFQAQVRTRGVLRDPKDPASGASLRISTDNPESFVSGDSEWKVLEHSFEVPSSGLAVELICELRGLAGEAWFAADSLKLVKLK